MKENAGNLAKEMRTKAKREMNRYVKQASFRDEPMGDNGVCKLRVFMPKF
jgi:hypothetical protein